MSDPHSHWALSWLPLAWPVLWVRAGGRFCVLHPSRSAGATFRAHRSAGWAVAAGACWPENHLPGRQRHILVAGCTPQDSASLSLGTTALSGAWSPAFQGNNGQAGTQRVSGSFPPHYPGSVDKQKSNKSSCGVLIGIGCVLLSKRKRRRQVRRNSSLTATFSWSACTPPREGGRSFLSIIW